MKKKLFVALGAILCLGAGIATAAHVTDTNLFGLLAKDNVESLAACEATDSAGNILGGCAGESKTDCWFDNIRCDGKEFRN